MQLQSKPLVDESVLKARLSHPAPMASSISCSRTQPADAIQFAARTGQSEAAKEATAQMDRVARNELVFEDNFYGFMPLNKLSATQTELAPGPKAQAEAYADLLAYALRPVTMDKKTEQTLRDKLDHPTDTLAGIMRKFGVSADDFRTPIIDPHRIDVENDVPQEVLARMGKLGLFALKIPKEYGGLGMCQKGYSTMLAQFAKLTNSPTLTSILSAHSTIGSAPLKLFGTDAQKHKYFPMIAQGNFLVAFGLTEPRAGTDVQGLETTASQQPDGSWKLNGQKIFITNTINAGLAYFVTGHTINKEGKDIGPTTFIVELPFKVNESREEKERKIHELSKQGMNILPVSGWNGLRLMVINGSNQTHILFKDFKVPAGNILGVAGDGLMVPFQGLTTGRAGFGPMLAESTRWFAMQSAAHLNDRLMTSMKRKMKKDPVAKAQLGPRVKEKAPLGEMEYPRTRLGDSVTKAATDLAVSELVAGLIDENPDMGVAGLSAAVKVMSSYDNWENAMTAMELHGGAGLIKGAPNQVERNFRDAWIPLIVEGVNPAMLQFMVAMGALPVRRAMTAGLPEASNRLKNWFTNVSEELSLLAKGKFSEAWQHHKNTSLFTVPEYGKMLKAQGRFLASQFNFERGALPLGEALWIQMHTREMALRFITLGLVRGNKAILFQNDTIRAAKVMMEILRVTAANIKLAKADEKLAKTGQDPLTRTERAALKTGIMEAKMRVNEEIQYLRLGIRIPFTSYMLRTPGHPVEYAKQKVGKLAMEDDLAEREAGHRKNVQDEYIAFLEKENARFQREVAEKYGST